MLFCLNNLQGGFRLGGAVGAAVQAGQSPAAMRQDVLLEIQERALRGSWPWGRGDPTATSTQLSWRALATAVQHVAVGTTPG